MFENICNLKKYLNYLYNLCFNTITSTENIENNHSEIHAYNIIFPDSKKNFITSTLNLVLDKIYKNELVPLDKKSKTNSIYLYDNKIYKLGHTNIKQYLDILNIIKNYNIPNIIVPDYIYKKKNITSSFIDYIQIFKYYVHGDLFDYIEKNNEYLDSNQKLNIYKKFINLVASFHTHGLAHRDIKLENIIVCYDNYGNMELKLIDLDFACIFNNDLDFNGGSIYYAPYEILNRKKIQYEGNDIMDWRAVDVWSCTTVLYTLLFNKFPWDNAKETRSNLLFIDYLYYYNNFNTDTYWINKLDSLNLDSYYLNLYFPILKHGFDIDHNKRIDIFYIQNLLNTY